MLIFFKVKLKADGNLTFYFNAYGRFEWKIADPSIVTDKWSEKWTNTQNGYKSNITLYGHKNGTTTLTLTNDQNKDKHVIEIIVSRFDIHAAICYNCRRCNKQKRL